VSCNLLCLSPLWRCFACHSAAPRRFIIRSHRWRIRKCSGNLWDPGPCPRLGTDVIRPWADGSIPGMSIPICNDRKCEAENRIFLIFMDSSLRAARPEAPSPRCSTPIPLTAVLISGYWLVLNTDHSGALTASFLSAIRLPKAPKGAEVSGLSRKCHWRTAKFLCIFAFLRVQYLGS
jgi:hypothetical protein